jgi:Ca-activated chloride channel family protein
VRPLQLEVKSQHIQTTITDQVARVTVTTTLRNPHGVPVEGIFLYPLPPDASVSDFSYRMGDREMKGELLDRDKARRIYEDIVRQLRDPALLEYQGGGVFKASIFPVEPRSETQTKLQFTQVLKAENGVVRYAHAVKLGRTNPNRGKLTVEVRVQSATAIKSVYSPTHQLDVVRQGDHQVKASCEETDTDFAQDFLLLYTLAERDFGVNVLTHRQGDEPGTFLLLLSPRQDWGDREIVGKDVVLVLDTSGSMQGRKMEQARGAFDYCLGALRPEDRFGLVTFATEARKLEDKLLDANTENVTRARQFVGKLQAAGATALNDALVDALGLLGKAGDRPAMIIFLTDGLPTAGERNTDRILKNVAAANGGDEKARRARLFVFGVGNDVNTHLLDQLAEANSGVSQYVRPGEDIEEAVSTLYRKLSHPVLTDLELSLPQAKPQMLYPSRLPDLFVGSQVVMVGRYEGNGPVAITLSGRSGGERQSSVYEANFPAVNAENDYLPRVWAVRRIGYLLDQIRLNGEEKELKDEVVRLALKYGIVTPYTSYLVQEDERVRRDRTGNIAQKGAFDSTRPEAAQANVAGAPAAPAPQQARDAMGAQVGGGAVHAAQYVRALKENSQFTRGDRTYQNVGRRTFYADGENWVDSGWREGLQVVKVQAFSAAYFELLQLRPDLATSLALGNRVQLQVGRLGLDIGAEGLTTLTDDLRAALKE